MQPIPSRMARPMDTVLRHEGGYVAANGADPETLFGITAANWATNITLLSPQDIGGMPPSLQDELIAIQNAKPAHRHALVSNFMKDTGRLLEPLHNTHHVGHHKIRDDSQPETGAPKRSTEYARPGINAEELQRVDDTRELAKTILFNQFATNFERFPKELSTQAILAAVNMGPARAMAMLLKSAHQADTIDESTSIELTRSATKEFVRYGKLQAVENGQDFHHPAIKQVEDTLNAVSQDKIDNCAKYLLQNIVGHYTALVLENPDKYAMQEAGWLERANMGFEEATGEKSTGMHAAVKMHHPTLPPVAPPPPPITLEAQYRDNGLSTLVALQIPGHGLIRYEIDELTHTFRHLVTPLPDTANVHDPVAILKPGRNAGNPIANPYPEEATITWLDNKGERHYQPLDAKFNHAIYHSAAVLKNGHTDSNTYLDLKNGALNPDQHEKITLEDHDKYQVEHMGKRYESSPMAKAFMQFLADSHICSDVDTPSMPAVTGPRPHHGPQR